MNPLHQHAQLFSGLHPSTHFCTLDQNKESTPMKTLWLAAFTLWILPATLWPQASSSTVRGTVHDQAHAVIPKAKVTLSNTSTNVSRTTETNESGIYVFPGVIPGPYRVVV